MRLNKTEVVEILYELRNSCNSSLISVVQLSSINRLISILEHDINRGRLLDVNLSGIIFSLLTDTYLKSQKDEYKAYVNMDAKGMEYYWFHTYGRLKESEL